MRKEKLISLLIILSMFVMSIPRVKAATDEWTLGTVDEDLFYATYKFEGVDMMYLQGEDMPIRSWFWFEGPVLQARRYVKEAYLEVRTPSIGSTDPDALMFIYGIPSQKGGTPSNADDPSYINGPYTTNYYQVNLSSFVGPGELHNITVSRIIREINQGYYYWDGHDIAFVTYSPAREDSEERTVSTIEAGHGAKLYIHYGEPDPGDDEYPDWLPDGGEFVEDYRNTTIWKVEHYAINFPFYVEDRDNANDLYYGDYWGSLADNTDQIFIADNSNNMEQNNRDTIAMVNETIIVMEDPAQVTMHVSNDLGESWASHILNDEYTDLAAHSTSSYGSMSVDLNGTVHMIWNTYTDTSPAATVAVYSNFTVTTMGTLDYYDGFDEFTVAHGHNNIEVDRHGRVHAGYVSGGDVDYTYRQIDGTWTAPIEIDGLETYQSVNLDVADHPNATRPPVVRFVYKTLWAGPDYIEQTILESDGDQTELYLSSDNAYLPATAMWMDGNVSIAVYQDNPGGGSGEIELRRYDFNTMTLGAVVYVTSTTQAHHDEPDIGIDPENNTAYIIWRNEYNGNSLYGRRYNLTTNAFIAAQERLTLPLDVNSGGSIVPWLTGFTEYTDWYVADMNGTLIGETTTSGEGNVSDIEDWIDVDIIGYPDPQDPDPPGWEDSPLTAHRFKLILFVIGMALFVGTPVWGFATRPDAAAWIAIMMSMLCGVALLWSLQLM